MCAWSDARVRHVAIHEAEVMGAGVRGVEWVTGPFVVDHVIDAASATGPVRAFKFPELREIANLGPNEVETDEIAPSMDDAQLIRRVAAGDREAFAELYDRHARTVYGAVLRYLGDPGVTEDVVQETYLAIWQRPDGYDAEKGSFIGWLLAIARNRAIDRLRAAARRPLLVGHDSRSADDTETDLERLMAQGRPVALAAAAHEPPDAAERGWVQAVVRTALDAMSEPERRVLKLAYDDGLTQSEIAAHLGWPQGTVKTRTRRGLLRLRAMLESVPDIGPWASGPPGGPEEDQDGVRHGPR